MTMVRAIAIAAAIALSACGQRSAVEPGGPAGAVDSPVRSARQFAILHAFTNGRDGGFPESGLIADTAGNLYGSTSLGGDPVCKCGTIFKLDAASGDRFRTVFSFKGGLDGISPWAAPLVDASGDLFGSTIAGGGSTACQFGCGTAFELTASSGGYVEHVLHRFQGGTSDGAYPQSTFVSDSAGNLYGTTRTGGITNCYGVGCGTIFELRRSGSHYTEKIVHRFAGGTDGGAPDGLFAAGDGNIYGTGIAQGCTSGTQGCITLFRVAPGGRYSVVFQGVGPSPATLDNGSFYGPGSRADTANPKCHNGCGDLFALEQHGSRYAVRTLHVFEGGADGAYPSAPVLASSSTLYGTTSACGNSCRIFGTVFAVETTGRGYRVLHRFDGADGTQPQSVLLSNGRLIGVTFAGGTGCKDGCGVIFSLTP